MIASGAPFPSEMIPRNIEDIRLLMERSNETYDSIEQFNQRIAAVNSIDQFTGMIHSYGSGEIRAVLSMVEDQLRTMASMRGDISGISIEDVLRGDLPDDSDDYIYLDTGSGDI